MRPLSSLLADKASMLQVLLTRNSVDTPSTESAISGLPDTYFRDVATGQSLTVGSVGPGAITDDTPRILFGDDGTDHPVTFFEGKKGNDRLYGGAGNDLLIGCEGNDYLERAGHSGLEEKVSIACFSRERSVNLTQRKAA